MDAALRHHLDAIPSERRRRDAETLVELMQRVTGETPTLTGSIVGFGTYHYRYESGREGDAAPVGFAARRAATTIYLMDGVGAHTDLLERLGPHTTGVACLYVKDLTAVDLDVLGAIVGRCYATVTSGGAFGQRARDGGEPSS